MLKLTEQQLAELSSLEGQSYVDEVRRTIVAEHPELAADEGLKPRLNDAYRHTQMIGFIDGAAVTEFLAYAAFAPSFYRQQAINAWLTKPGVPVEQRWSDLMQVLAARTSTAESEG